MTRFLFVMTMCFVFMVACDNKPNKITNLHLVDEGHGDNPALYKFHDDAGKVTCYVTWVGFGGGISCLRDEATK